MNIISSSNVRKNWSKVINKVFYGNTPVVVGKHNRPEVMIIKFPQNYNENINSITNINANSDSFKFLEDEKDLYSIDDLKIKYV